MNIDPTWQQLIAGAIGGIVTATVILQHAKIRILKRRIEELEMEVEILWK
jgi:hypothetical protein